MDKMGTAGGEQHARYATKSHGAIAAKPEFWGEVQPPASLTGLDIPRLRRSCATAWMVSANWSWRAGACRDRRSLAASRSPTSATSQSPHWRGWLSARTRCLVPATSFCEYADTKPRKTPTWFALSEDRPLFAFAGLWTRWQGVRGLVEGEHELFGFLTTEPNAIGGAHPSQSHARDPDHN
jgi:putative SOS response-associated peptidase YedK